MKTLLVTVLNVCNTTSNGCETCMAVKEAGGGGSRRGGANGEKWRKMGKIANRKMLSP